MSLLYTSSYGDPNHPTILFLHGGGAAPTLVVAGQGEYKVVHQSVRDAAIAIPGAQARLVHHTTKLSLSQQHTWSMTAPELYNRTVRAWIEGQPLPQELQELK